MLRYLEKGSQKSFDNFCLALSRNKQSHLINSMNERLTKYQQPRSLNDKPLMSGDVSVERTAVECTEHSADETRKLSTEAATESHQGCSFCILLLS